MIEVKNLVKRYGDHVAVNHLNFTVEEGQIYGFLGPNGAGKSTTMNMITGYLAATEGEVIINGHNILDDPEEAKKCIGYLPEMPPVYMDMTVLEYLKFVAELKKIPKDKVKKQLMEVMSLVKITDMQNRLIRNLSKGYRQRVGLAQAVIGYPPIIILDEPTVGLDPKQIIEIRELIKSLGKKHTVILSSHILSEVSAVCDYVMIISKGELVASDTPENLGKLMIGSNTVKCTVKGSRGAVISALNQIPEIKNVKYEDAEEKGCLRLVITTDKSKDIREPLFYKMAAASCPILALSSSTMSLEDVFLELTDDSGKAARKLKKEMKKQTDEKEQDLAVTQEETAKTDSSQNEEEGGTKK
ncbi:MAG: ABC transporter ATP-binding protein [Fusicatenibacter sp.]|nr:ABC transporter ATP-binding protein [Fusicatenibacter sp.]